MKTIEEQLDARKKLTAIFKAYMFGDKETKQRLEINLNEGIRLYESRFGESFRPYYERRGE